LAQDQVGAYTVVPGDTLFEIAQRFGVSLDALIALNQISDPSLIQVGQILLIPSATATLATLPTNLVQARPGDTLLKVAQRYNQGVDVLTAINRISATTRLFPGQPIRLPAGQAPPSSLRFGSVRRIRLSAPLVQGRTAQLWVETTRPLSLTATWNGLPLAFTLTSITATEQVALLPTPALLEPGVYPLTIAYRAANGVTLRHEEGQTVVAGNYESQVIDLPPDRTSLLDPTLVTSETQLVSTVWSQVSPLLWWQGRFRRPIAPQYETTSPFGTRRSYNGGPFASYHAGQDFGAPVGVTVTAPADGVVALAQPLQVRGNAILLDHGRGIFTGYWHLNELRVAVGQKVAAGDLIGLVGNTGLSTGAHLHWELRINGIAVDPTQFWEEPLLKE
jgi:murein DD-endopeptidase MepM/ murein hydrolase activator NlpD